ncbi:N-acylglucosamine 2-epimerase [candidate division KSB3 bacterium]|uniref:N-acylglucosamine 2-epimerase n=1 Tax=candidate division KSB3 bacterium TaxID=2044937 RepID=A0A2G6E0V9_9BACT|nr:MAG: N-acylglucosamine 2-epimerase [candidate division KSB3 bacterium]PIE28333.1 MAG: N-acylglucosamine 2-epimerase [candidate division KSB3 bacterium]
MPDNTPLVQSHPQKLLQLYREGLLHDTLPFWIEHSIDRDHGGFMFCLDRDGTVLDTDKGMWQQGRFTWTLANLYNTVEPREEWLELAAHGIQFIRKYGFDDDGRMFFQVTRDGRPVRKRRYLFTETFGTIALAAYAKASGDERAKEEALHLFELIVRYLSTPDLIPPKCDPAARAGKSLAVPMIMIATTQVLRETIGDVEFCNQWIDRCIREIEQDFMKPEFRAVPETVGPAGEAIDHFDGRLLCPGHSIEAAWFILHEAKQRGNDPKLLALGTTILDWMWEWGWDKEYGGILYYRDIKALPVQEYWQDMKFWWPQNEAIIATLLAFHLTGDEKYAHWHQLIHDWAYTHFPDATYGEWYGYLHRDGRISIHSKGNLWKGPFHLPRMQLYCWKLLEEASS